MEVWAFLHADAGEVCPPEEFMLGMSGEARRLADFLGAMACGIIVQADYPILETVAVPQVLDRLYILVTVDREYGIDTYVEAMAWLYQERGPAILLAAANALGADVGGRLAADLGMELWPRVVDYEQRGGETWLRRSAYNDAVHVLHPLEQTQGAVVTVLPDVLAPSEDRKGAGETIILSVPQTRPDGQERVHYLERKRVPREELALEEATLVVGIGRGVGDHAGMLLVEDLAKLLDAPLGATRVAVEMGLSPRERQVGLSGTFLNADVYLAIGISGATHHLEGIRRAKKVIAINTDPHAPIAEIAQLMIVGDFRVVVQALIEEIRRSRYNAGGCLS